MEIAREQFETESDQYHFGSYWRTKIRRWLKSQSRVMAFRLNDEFLFYSNAEVDYTKKKIKIVIAGSEEPVTYNLWARDYERYQYLVY